MGDDSPILHASLAGLGLASTQDSTKAHVFCEADFGQRRLRHDEPQRVELTACLAGKANGSELSVHRCQNATFCCSVWNGHYQSTCHHPLFVFNQFADLERCALRSGNVRSADGREAVPKPVEEPTRTKSHVSISGPMPPSDTASLAVAGDMDDDVDDRAGRDRDGVGDDAQV